MTQGLGLSLLTGSPGMNSHDSMYEEQLISRCQEQAAGEGDSRGAFTLEEAYRLQSTR